MKKQNVRTLVLIVCTFTYLLIGAAIFDALESGNERIERYELNKTEQEIKALYNMSDEHFQLLRDTLMRSQTYQAGIQWKFAGAFYFALSVITTIGYGHSTPRTLGGKAFCIAYASIGIPLNIVMFQSIGERFNMGIMIILRRLKKAFRFQSSEVSSTQLTVIGFCLCTCVLLLGAAAFHYFEAWPFTDAFYYCFITMSTIGFGDFVALQGSIASLQTQPEYVAFTILYILFGLTVFAASLNLMVLKLLTMNTEDELKDELEALAARKASPQVEGDILRCQRRLNSLHSLDVRAPDPMEIDMKLTDAPSNHMNHSLCCCLPKNKAKPSKIRYTAKHPPSEVRHLLPLSVSSTMASITKETDEQSTPPSADSGFSNGRLSRGGLNHDFDGLPEIIDETFLSSAGSLKE